MNALTGIILTVLGVEDLRTKTIPVWLISVMILAAAVYGVCTQPILICAAGMLPGLFFVLLSFFGTEIGMGDGLITLAYGFLYGWKRTCLWLMYSFLFAAIIGLMWKVLCRKNKVTLPFVPFMAIVHMGMCV